MNIQTVSEKMKRAGFEYCAMVSTLSLDAYRTPQAMANVVSLKPATPTLACSRIQECDGGMVPEWYLFVVGEDFRVDEYSRRDLLFVKTDPSRLVTESDPRFGKNGAWRMEEEGSRYMPTIRWPSVVAACAGITVDPAKFEVRDVFPAWDVDTLAVWDSSCITDAMAFRNVGEWLYGEEEEQMIA
jgi:hypothetical protein